MTTVNAKSLDKLLKRMEQYPVPGNETVTLRWQYQVGILAWWRFRDALSYARMLGLKSELNHGYGFFVKRGDAMVEGPWWKVRTFTATLQSLGMG